MYIIAVDRGIITANNNEGTDKPPIVVKNKDQKIYARIVKILDKEGNIVAQIVYDAKDSKNYGNKAWIEVFYDILIE